MRKQIRLLPFLLVLITIVSVLSLPASAEPIVDANTGGGATGNSQTASGGYSIPALWATGYGDYRTVFGMRFSVYDTDTGESSRSIDIYRSTCTNADSYAVNARVATKYNHKQWSDNWNKYAMEKTDSTADSAWFWDSDLGISLPTSTTTFESTVKSNTVFLDEIVYRIDGRALEELDYYDKILCEPIYPLSIGGTSYNMTVAEIAAYGANYFGPDVTIVSSAADGSWGYIADYTNMLFPNALYAGDGSNVFGSCAELTTYASFRTILNYGYGTGIAYNPQATEPPMGNLIVNYYNGGTKVDSRTYAADADCSNGLLNYSTSGSTLYTTKTGYTGTGMWKVGSNSSTTKIDEDTGYTTGADLAKALGVDISTSDKTVNVFMDWDAVDVK